MNYKAINTTNHFILQNLLFYAVTSKGHSAVC